MIEVTMTTNDSKEAREKVSLIQVMLHSDLKTDLASRTKS